MRILVHDYPGFAFPVQLSRELAKHGHEVLHLYAGYNITPRGPLNRNSTDPECFSIRPIYIRKPLQKYSFVMRWRQEREYGQLLSSEINNFQPDVMISAQTPLDAQSRALKTTQEHGIRFVFWLQDVIGIATKNILRKRIPIFGGIIGQYYIRLERQLLIQSDQIVLITDDFLPLMQEWGVNGHRLSVIPNWAPLENLTPKPKVNTWSSKWEFADRFCFMYTGTLGMKHNPDLLLQLALHFRKEPNVVVVVVSEGPGAEWLKKQKENMGLENLHLFEYQPFDRLPFVMGSADVLVAILDPDAGVFSVPSKVLTYLCAQRPLLLAVPTENLAAKIVSQNKAGIVVPPKDVRSFIQAAERLVQNTKLREEFANNAKGYAEEHFDIQKIGDQFEAILEKTTGN